MGVPADVRALAGNVRPTSAGAKPANSELGLNDFSGLGLAESKQNGFLKRKKTRKSWAAAAAPNF